MGARPHAEFFIIVMQHSTAASIFGGAFAQVINRLLHLVERHQVTQLFKNGKYLDCLSFRLRHVIPIQVLWTQPGTQEVGVIQRRVFHTGLGEHCGQVRFPHTLRQPEPFGHTAERPLTKLLHAQNLTSGISFGDGAQHGFIIPAAHDFHLSRFHQRCKPFQKFRRVDFKPVKQRPGKMQRHPHRRILLQHVQERPVGLMVRLLKNKIKITHRLMGMTAKYKIYAFQRKISLWKHTSEDSAIVPSFQAPIVYNLYTPFPLLHHKSTTKSLYRHRHRHRHRYRYPNRNRNRNRHTPLVIPVFPRRGTSKKKDRNPRNRQFIPSRLIFP